MNESSLFSRFLDVVCHYQTVKIVDIKNRKVGAAYRLIQLLVLAYIIGYVIVYKKGYQDTDVAISTVMTKLKGTTYIDFANYSSLLNGIQIYDAADYVIPPQEPDTFFVMTNMIITPNQTQGKCSENLEFQDNWCRTDSDCQPSLRMVTNGNGVRTGSCIPSHENRSINVCEIYAWCPLEIDYKPMPLQGNNRKKAPLLDAAKDFTVLIKNQVVFTKFGIKRRNIFGYKSKSKLRRCRFNKETAPHCPIFRLRDIVAYAGENFTNVAYKGAIFAVHINWDCNFDHDEDKCTPTYSFQRIDSPNTPLSRGYNFRYSRYYVINGKRYRTLTKAFGLRFVIRVRTSAGKFHIIPLLLHIGAGFALMALANIWCDIIALHCLKSKKVYAHRKFSRVDTKMKRGDDEGKRSEFQNSSIDMEEEEEDEDKKKSMFKGAAKAVLEDETCSGCCSLI